MHVYQRTETVFMNISFYYHSLRRDLTNFSYLHHLKFDSFLVSMHQSGTHWLKYMLASAISAEYKLPMPKYNHANEIIRGYKEPQIYPNIPRIGHSHSIPSPLFKSDLLRSIIKHPPYVVLVRDIRDSLISCYEKWKSRYDCDFSEYLRGDVKGIRFRQNDIWWCIRFLNTWGSVIKKHPQTTLVVRYEDLRLDPACHLNRINNFMALKLGRDSIEFAISESTKDKMKDKNDPVQPIGAGVVRDDHAAEKEHFTAADKEFLKKVCARFLKHNFGYKY